MMIGNTASLVSVLVIVVIVVVVAVAIGYHLSPRTRYADFYAIARVEFRTPGLDSAFVPQGICRIDSAGLYAVCGYMAGAAGMAGRLYLVEAASHRTLKMITLKYEDGREFRGHAGGVAAWGDSIWIASDEEGYRLLLADALAAADGTGVAFTDRFKAPLNAAFAFASDGLLWLGEFYEKADYPTPASHAFTVAGGETNHAIVCAFKIATSMSGGVASTTPVMALSIREKVQGMARTKSGDFVLSTSYGRRNDSWLYVYENVTTRAPDARFPAADGETPLWYLDASGLKLKLKLPPMAESLDTVDGRVLVLFESGSEKYRCTARLPQKDIWSVLLP